MGGWRLRGAMLLAAVLAVGLTIGLGAALAADPSASPTAGGQKVVLKVGLLEEPDSLNPFVGYGTMGFEAWCLNYDFVVGYGAKDGSPVPGIAESWKRVAGRQDLDVQDPPRRHVE